MLWGLPIVVAALAAGHRLSGTWASVVVAPWLWGTGSRAVTRGFRCSVACGIFPDQGLNSFLMHGQALFTTEPPEKPYPLIFDLSLKAELLLSSSYHLTKVANDPISGHIKRILFYLSCLTSE